MQNQRAATIVVALVGVASAFLPWVTVPIVGSVSGMDGSDGWIVIGVFAVAALFAFSSPPIMTGGKRFGVAFFGLAGTGIAVWKILQVYDIKERAAHEAGEFASAMSNAVQVGFGLWAMAAAGIALVLMGLFMKVQPTAVVAAVPACGSCGAPCTWVAEHQRHFCTRCNAYV